MGIRGNGRGGGDGGGSDSGGGGGDGGSKNNGGRGGGKTEVSRMASLSRVAGRSVAVFTTPLFMSLGFFNHTRFLCVNGFSFQQFVNVKFLFLENKKSK